MKESAVQSHVRLELAKIGPFWRNNVGACQDATGRLIRYGLCNDTAQLNKRIKSSDEIGITPVLITPEWFGQILGVFTAVEIKRSGWTYNPNDEHEIAQKRYHDIVRESGGFAGFARAPADIYPIVRRRLW